MSKEKKEPLVQIKKPCFDLYETEITICECDPECPLIKDSPWESCKSGKLNEWYPNWVRATAPASSGDTDMVVLLNHVLELHRNAAVITCPDDCLCWEVEGLLMQEGLKDVDESDKEPDPHLSALRGLVDECRGLMPILEQEYPQAYVNLKNAIAAAEDAMGEEREVKNVC